jgi:hypothetical protein
LAGINATIPLGGRATDCVSPGVLKGSQPVASEIPSFADHDSVGSMIRSLKPMIPRAHPGDDYCLANAVKRLIEAFGWHWQ